MIVHKPIVTGEEYNGWFVKSRVWPKHLASKDKYYLCLCPCGNECTIRATHLRFGRQRMCRECNIRLLDQRNREGVIYNVGDRLQNWTILERLEPKAMPSGCLAYSVRVQCDCGTIAERWLTQLTSIKSIACFACYNKRRGEE